MQNISRAADDNILNTTTTLHQLGHPIVREKEEFHGF